MILKQLKQREPGDGSPLPLPMVASSSVYNNIHNNNNSPTTLTSSALHVNAVATGASQAGILVPSGATPNTLNAMMTTSVNLATANIPTTPTVIPSDKNKFQSKFKRQRTMQALLDNANAIAAAAEKVTIKNFVQNVRIKSRAHKWITALSSSRRLRNLTDIEYEQINDKTYFKPTKSSTSHSTSSSSHSNSQNNHNHNSKHEGFISTTNATTPSTPNHSTNNHNNNNNINNQNQNNNTNNGSFTGTTQLLQQLETTKRQVSLALSTLIQRVLERIPILSPNSVGKLAWDTLTSLLILCMNIMIQLKISVENYELSYYFGYSSIAQFIVLLVFLADVLVSGNTAFFERGAISRDRSHIISNYLSSSGVYDILLVQALAYEVLKEEGSSKFLESIQDLVLLACLIVKSLKLNKYVFRIEEALSLRKRTLQLLSLAKLLFFILEVSHTFACIWLYIGRQKVQSAQASWLTGMEQESWEAQYLTAYYFICVTMTTIGFGDIVPKNSIEMLVSIFSMIIACVTFGYTINCIGSIFMELQKDNEDRKENLLVINRYMNEKSISRDLQSSVREYLEYYWSQSSTDSSAKERTILAQLSEDIRSALLLQANRMILEDCAFLQRNFSQEVMKKAVHLIKERKFTPGETITSSDVQTSAGSLFFVERGEVDLFQEFNFDPQTTQNENSIFYNSANLLAYTNVPAVAAATTTSQNNNNNNNNQENIQQSQQLQFHNTQQQFGAAAATTTTTTAMSQNLINQTQVTGTTTGGGYSSGTTSIAVSSSRFIKKATTIKRGQYFGEVSFFTNCPNEFTAKSRGFSKILFIERQAFLDFLKGNFFHDDYETFCHIKDSISQREISILQSKCAFCQSFDHSLLHCCNIHFTPIRMLTFCRYNYSAAIVNRTKHTRKSLLPIEGCYKINARKCLTQINEQIADFQDKNEEYIQDNFYDEGSVYSHSSFDDDEEDEDDIQDDDDENEDTDNNNKEKYRKESLDDENIADSNEDVTSVDGHLRNNNVWRRIEDDRGFGASRHDSDVEVANNNNNDDDDNKEDEVQERSGKDKKRCRQKEKSILVKGRSYTRDYDLYDVEADQVIQEKRERNKSQVRLLHLESKIQSSCEEADSSNNVSLVITPKQILRIKRDSRLGLDNNSAFTNGGVLTAAASLAGNNSSAATTAQVLNTVVTPIIPSTFSTFSRHVSSQLSSSQHQHQSNNNRQHVHDEEERGADDNEGKQVEDVTGRAAETANVNGSQTVVVTPRVKSYSRKNTSPKTATATAGVVVHPANQIAGGVTGTSSNAQSTPFRRNNKRSSTITFLVNSRNSTLKSNLVSKISENNNNHNNVIQHDSKGDKQSVSQRRITRQQSTTFQDHPHPKHSIVMTPLGNNGLIAPTPMNNRKGFLIPSIHTININNNNNNNSTPNNQNNNNNNSQNNLLGGGGVFHRSHTRQKSMVMLDQVHEFPAVGVASNVVAPTTSSGMTSRGFASSQGGQQQISLLPANRPGSVFAHAGTLHANSISNAHALLAQTSAAAAAAAVAAATGNGVIGMHNHLQSIDMKWNEFSQFSQILQFETMKIFKNYFPQFNHDKIIGKIRRKRIQETQIGKATANMKWVALQQQRKKGGITNLASNGVMTPLLRPTVNVVTESNTEIPINGVDSIRKLSYHSPSVVLSNTSEPNELGPLIMNNNKDSSNQQSQQLFQSGNLLQAGWNQNQSIHARKSSAASSHQFLDSNINSSQHVLIPNRLGTPFQQRTPKIKFHTTKSTFLPRDSSTKSFHEKMMSSLHDEALFAEEDLVRLSTSNNNNNNPPTASPYLPPANSISLDHQSELLEFI